MAAQSPIASSVFIFIFPFGYCFFICSSSCLRGGTFVKSGMSPSSMVGWVKMASRNAVGQSRNHRDLHGRHDFSGLDSEDGEAKDAIALCFDEGFHEASGLGKRSGSQYRDERDFGDSIGNTTLVRLHFAQTDAGELGVREHAERHLPSGGHAMATQDIIAHGAEVIEGYMCEMRAASTVTHRPDIRRRCFKAFVDLHVTVVGRFHSGLSQANTIRVR